MGPRTAAAADHAASRTPPAHLPAAHRTFRKNVSLLDRADVNGGCQWVVTSKLFRAADLPVYLSHPQHKELGAIQAPLLTGKFVVDVDA